MSAFVMLLQGNVFTGGTHARIFFLKVVGGEAAHILHAPSAQAHHMQSAAYHHQNNAGDKRRLEVTSTSVAVFFA